MEMTGNANTNQLQFKNPLSIHGKRRMALEFNIVK
jgi:hypothetical protein